VILGTWNIRAGDARAHAERLRKHYGAGVFAIQECRQPPPLDMDIPWAGAIPSKGLAVVCSDGFEIAALPGPHSHDDLPVRVLGPRPFTFMGLWSHGSLGVTYPECVRNTVRAYREVLRDQDVVLAGDLNSNQEFAHLNRRLTHADLVQWLHESLGVVSAWHAVRSEAPGQESTPTYYHRGKQKAPFHLDYVFVPEHWLPSITRVEIGSFDEWSSSDHRPVIVEIQAI